MRTFPPQLVLLLAAALVARSSDPQRTLRPRPPPQWAQREERTDEQTWSYDPFAPVPHEVAPKRRVIAPYRLATKASVSFAFLLLAWRSAELRELLAGENGLLGWTRARGALLWANTAACFLVYGAVSLHLLKFVLACDAAVELHLLLASARRALFRPDAQPLPSGLASLGFALIAVTLLRSKWISDAVASNVLQQERQAARRSSDPYTFVEPQQPPPFADDASTYRRPPRERPPPGFYDQYHPPPFQQQ